MMIKLQRRLLVAFAALLLVGVLHVLQPLQVRTTTTSLPLPSFRPRHQHDPSLLTQHAEEDETARFALPHTPSLQSLLPCCILHETCQLTWLGSNRKQWALTPSFPIAPKDALSFSQLLDSCGNLTEQLLLHDEVWYVVEDGCAMGHMLKDVGAVLALHQHWSAALEKQQPSSGTGGLRKTIRVQFANPCVGTDVSAIIRTSPTTKSARHSLFDNVLRHWWAALYRFSQRTQVQARSVIDIDFSLLPSPPTSAANGPRRVIVRRSPQWRWFPPTLSASLIESFRQSAVQTYFLPRTTHLAPLAPPPPQQQQQDASSPTDGALLRVTVLLRKNNRRFPDHLLIGLLHEAYSDIVVETAEEGEKESASRRRYPLVELHHVDFETAEYPVQVLHLASRCDVLIAAHGAALASAFFLPPGSALIELFPPHFRYSIYQELALSTGVHYFAVEGQVSSCGKRCAPLSSAASFAQMRQRNSSESTVSAYDALRQWNGRGKCKNCDFSFRPFAHEGTTTTPSASSPPAVDKIREHSLERQGILERVLPVVQEAMRVVLLEKVRRGTSKVPISTTLFLDRRG
jgi:hypothetical protein